MQRPRRKSTTGKIQARWLSPHKGKRLNVLQVLIHFRHRCLSSSQTMHKKNRQPALSIFLLPFKQTWFFWFISGNDRHFTTHSAHPELINTTTDIRLDFIHLFNHRKCSVQQNSIHYKRFYGVLVVKGVHNMHTHTHTYTYRHTDTHTHTPAVHKEKTTTSNFPVANEIKTRQWKLSIRPPPSHNSTSQPK